MLSWGAPHADTRPAKMEHKMATEAAYNRRQFLTRAASAALSAALPLPAHSATALGAGVAGLHGRYITHVSIVRVNQIEVTPTRSIGQDEVPDNSIARIQSR